MLTITICLTFISCSRTDIPKGTYTDNIGFAQLTFQRNDVEMVTRGAFSMEIDESTKQTGKFRAKQGKVYISWDDGGEDQYYYNAEKDELSMGNGALMFTKTKE